MAIAPQSFNFSIHNWASAEKLDGKIACDLGCGTGELAIRLNEKGWDVIAVDCSEEMLDVFMDKGLGAS